MYMKKVHETETGYDSRSWIFLSAGQTADFLTMRKGKRNTFK